MLLAREDRAGVREIGFVSVVEFGVTLVILVPLVVDNEISAISISETTSMMRIPPHMTLILLLQKL